MGGWGVAPSARSTPTRAQRRDTPKIKLNFNLTKNKNSCTSNFSFYSIFAPII
ncbi:MAG: hypothetical protein NZ455_09825 [Bacteroidia bacterium]|nr:hypothetical protein [Bacteroidia bacterium]MDW8345568.1 hypothetical protein [Bacteroidia bacterium]